MPKKSPLRKAGIVYLVGAGPGDPRLITIRAAECLEKADVILYDFLANSRLLKLAPEASEKIYVGKRGAYHAGDQSRINQALIAKARQGKTVVRLKGGDPFIFGRGGEEAEALAAAQIPFEVVPGVTSAIAAPAYAGIPLTHRDLAADVTIVTGHESDTTEKAGINWSSLAHMGTVVFLMGWKNLPTIVQKMIAAGKDPKTPVAVIEWGTMPRQKTVTGTLDTIVSVVRERNIRPPTIIVVGQVVALRSKLSWFEKKPLFGKTILVTRAREQAGFLRWRLEELGAEVIEIPLIEIRPPRNQSLMDRAIGRLGEFDIVIFTSVNGAHAFFKRLEEKGLDVRALAGMKIAAVGATTAEAIEKNHLNVDLIPTGFPLVMGYQYSAEGLLKTLAREKVAGKRILFVRAEEGREVLVDGLKKLKARVDLVPAYRNVCPPESRKELQKVLKEKKVDMVVFTSSSTVRNFISLAGGLDRVRHLPVASIGPVTSKTVKEERLKLAVEARQSTIPDLVESISDYFKGPREGC